MKTKSQIFSDDDTTNKIMKHTIRLALSGTAVLLAASGAQAADKIYLEVAAGPAFQQDTSVKTGPFGTGGNVRFDTGTRAGLTLGYQLTQDFAAELETGVIWNSVNSIQGNSLSAFGARADVYEIPFLLNLVYKPWHGSFVPYVGLGAGGAATLFDSANIPPFGPNASYSDTDFTFAYQATVGCNYVLCKHMELGLAYKFMGTTDHKWSDQNITFKTDGNLTHAVMATVTWRF